MPAYEAHGRTDVWSDPNYINAMLQHKNPVYREQAREAMTRLQHRDDMNFAAMQHAAQQAATRANLQETIRARQSAERDRQTEREERAKEVAGYRQDLMSQRQSEQADRQAEAMLRVIPFLQGKDAPAMTQQILAQYYQRMGITPPATPVDPGAAAAARFAASQGQKVVNPPGGQPATAPTTPAVAPVAAGGAAGGTPTTPAAPQKQLTGYHWFAGTGGIMGGNNAQQINYYDDGSSEVVPATSTPGVQTLSAGPTMADLFRQGAEKGRAEGTPYVEGGQVYNAPAGQSYNVSTGQWSPSNLVGTINGKPENVAVAEAALRTGKAPTYSSDATYNMYQAAKTAQNVNPANLSANMIQGTGGQLPPTGAPPNEAVVPTLEPTVVSPSQFVKPPASAEATPSAQYAGAPTVTPTPYAVAQNQVKPPPVPTPPPKKPEDEEQ